MDTTELTLIKRLSRDRIIKKMPSLIGLGYSQKQALDLLERESSLFIAEALIKLYPKLIKLGTTPDECFDNMDLYTIAYYPDAEKTFNALIYFYADLSSLGFSKKDIFKMADHEGGFKNLKAVHDYFDTLLKNGCPTDALKDQLTDDFKKDVISFFSTGQDEHARDLFFGLLKELKPITELKLILDEMVKSQMTASVQSRGFSPRWGFFHLLDSSEDAPGLIDQIKSTVRSWPEVEFEIQKCGHSGC